MVRIYGWRGSAGLRGLALAEIINNIGVISELQSVARLGFSSVLRRINEMQLVAVGLRINNI